jgi:hypothetical protein
MNYSSSHVDGLLVDGILFPLNLLGNTPLLKSEASFSIIPTKGTSLVMAVMKSTKIKTLKT